MCFRVFVLMRGWGGTGCCCVHVRQFEMLEGERAGETCKNQDRVKKKLTNEAAYETDALSDR